MINRELKAAMLAAHYTYTGTSLAEGAMDILRFVYSPHIFTGENEKCNRCGKAKADPLHR